MLRPFNKYIQTHGHIDTDDEIRERRWRWTTKLCLNAAPKTHLSEAVPNPESFTIAHEQVARTAEISNPILLPPTIVVHSNTYYLVVSNGSNSSSSSSTKHCTKT
ncbi:hypothetical protein PV325_000450 [Microctonus aethiopoides]|nr:hypothetical protein PV325_000450 [Microctonus aethiopoides]